MAAPFGRIVTAMITPFAADGSVDLDGARAIARHLVRHGSEGLVVAGTTGESPTLSDDEKLALLEAVKDVVGGEATIVAGTGSNDTAHSAHLTRAAVRAGADAVLVVTPYYNKPPAEGIYRHFRTVAAAADDRPVIVYNIPQRVVLNLPPALLFRLAEIDNVRAVKQATADLDQAQAILEDGRLALYAGDDTLLRAFGEIGGCGGITVASHVAGDEMLEQQRALDDGDHDRGRALDEHLAPLYQALAVTTNPIPVRAAMELLGFSVGEPRLPLVAATAAEKQVVRAALAARGLLAATA
jgi:4-hydroxy-tetrahydrodipicolinate synthase